MDRAENRRMDKPTLCRAQLEWCIEGERADAFVANLQNQTVRADSIFGADGAQLVLANIKDVTCDVSGFRIVHAVFQNPRAFSSKNA